MQILSDLTAPAYFADQRLFCLLPSRTVKISLQHGISSDSAYAISNLGFMLGFDPFAVTVMAIVSPGLRATWSKSTASSQSGESLRRVRGGCRLDTADRDRDRFRADRLSRCDRYR